MALPGDKVKSNVRGYVDFNLQLQPNGLDLTVKRIFKFKGLGSISLSSKELPEYEEVEWEGEEITLKPGAYLIEFNEIVKVPVDQVGMVFPRSSLLRMGCDLRGALWDSGYEGRSKSLLVVYNTLKIKRNARIGQLVFFKVLGEVEKPYSGEYQYEDLS